MRKAVGIAAAILALLVLASCHKEVQYERVVDRIEVGDFLQLGVYNNEPVVWRCVSIDENGPLMLSDRIISIKPFDAGGDDISGSHGRGYDEGENRRATGSNYWADSNIRDWLNSVAAPGKVEWSCGNAPTADKVTYNAYADEAGFLHDFSESDLGYIKEVTQKVIIDGYEYSSDNMPDENAYTYNNTIEEIIANYDTALSEETTDRIFLLDVKQLDMIYRSGDVLGSDYYIGAPTHAAAEASDYEEEWLTEGVKWYYWLRTPNATDHSSTFVKLIAHDGEAAGSLEANDGRIGVRPAFYLNTENINFTSGAGRDIDPYRLQKLSD